MRRPVRLRIGAIGSRRPARSTTGSNVRLAIGAATTRRPSRTRRVRRSARTPATALGLVCGFGDRRRLRRRRARLSDRLRGIRALVTFGRRFDMRVAASTAARRRDGAPARLRRRWLGFRRRLGDSDRAPAAAPASATGFDDDRVQAIGLRRSARDRGRLGRRHLGVAAAAATIGCCRRGAGARRAAARQRLRRGAGESRSRCRRRRAPRPP